MGGSDFRPGFDERREVWRLLHHLDPPIRVRFLQDCCDRVSSADVKTAVTECDGTVNDTYAGILMLGHDRGLSLAAIGERLVRWVRAYGVRPTARRSGVGWRVRPARADGVNSGLVIVGQ